jgi:hypothetical protein
MGIIWAASILLRSIGIGQRHFVSLRSESERYQEVTKR